MLAAAVFPIVALFLALLKATSFAEAIYIGHWYAIPLIPVCGLTGFIAYKILGIDDKKQSGQNEKRPQTSERRLPSSVDQQSNSLALFSLAIAGLFLLGLAVFSFLGVV